MKKLTSVLVGVLVLGGMFFAVEANAQTVGDLQAQIKALLAQVQALQAQIQRTSPSIATPSVPAVPAGECVAAVFENLSRGSRGAEIFTLQQALRQVGTYLGPVTGFFGPLTQTAVAAFQAENGLSATGMVDRETAAAINRTTSCSAEEPRTPAQTSTPNSASTLMPVEASTLAPQSSMVISWGGGSGKVQVGVIDGRFEQGGTILGWITTNGITSGSLTWDGKTVNDLTGNAKWSVSSLSQGPFRILGVTAGPTGNFCAGMGGDCKYVLSNPFSISYAPSTIQLPAFSVSGTPSSSPSITVLSPNGGEVWYAGETKRILWQASGVSSIQIDLYDDRIAGSGAIVSTIAAYNSLPPSQGYYDWTIPASVLKNNDGKNFTIHIYDDGARRSDRSNAPFSIISSAGSGALVAPSGISANADSQNQVTVRWVYGTAAIGGFELERSVSLSDGWSVIYTAPGGTGIYLDRGVTAGTAYYYRVRAFNVSPGGGKNYSSYSGVASVRTSLVGIGDVDGDGVINCTDVTWIGEVDVGLRTLTAEQKARADIDGNGVISAYDAALLVQKYGLNCAAIKPSIASIYPTSAPADGTTQITLNGSGFNNSMKVTLVGRSDSGRVYDTSFSAAYSSPSVIRFVVPTSIEPGSYQISVSEFGRTQSNYVALQVTSVPQSPPHTLTVLRSGSGNGTITTTDFKISNCNPSASSCSASYPSGTEVYISLALPSGSTLGAWTGCDSVVSQSGACRVIMNSSRTVTVESVATQPTAASPFETGDVNGDRSINCTDVTWIQEASIGLRTLTAEQKTRADVNSSGSVSSYDAALLMQQNSLTCTSSFTPSAAASLLAAIRAQLDEIELKVRALVGGQR